MSSVRRIVYGSATCIALALAAELAFAQQAAPPSPADVPQGTSQIRPDLGEAGGNGRPGVFMQVPVTNLTPGAAPNRPSIKNPNQTDPQSMQRGMTYFISFNCIGCHADNGGGGMGPALSNRDFIYGSAPENIYLSIYQGRPNGMPAWGAALPETVIWDLVTYIGYLSNEPNRDWGRTFSPATPSPDVEQVPAEVATTPKPWSNTRPFKFGQKP